MEVIKHGNTYKEVECKKCGALFSYCKSDVIKESDYCEYYDRFHWIDKKYIICPECNNTITLEFKIDGDERDV